MSATEPKDTPSPGGSATPTDEVDPELLKEVEARAKEVSADCKKEMDAKLQHLEKTLKNTMANTNVQMRDFSERYQSHRQSQITENQTDVLRVNKMMRDIARELGQDWKPVFKKLMCDFDDSAVEAEIVTIEQQKPFIQAYKAMTTWKDTMGKEFQAFALVEALNTAGRNDLAEKAMATLNDSEFESLYSMASFGTGIRSGTAAHGASGGSDSATPKEDADTESDMKENGTRARAGRPSGVVADDFTPVQGLLGDIVLLRVSRRMDCEYRPLGEALGVPEDELAEIIQNNGPTSSQGAFKMLWSWRNGLGIVSKTHEAILRGALKKLGKNDIAKSLD